MSVGTAPILTVCSCVLALAPALARVPEPSSVDAEQAEVSTRSRALSNASGIWNSRFLCMEDSCNGV